MPAADGCRPALVVAVLQQGRLVSNSFSAGGRATLPRAQTAGRGASDVGGRGGAPAATARSGRATTRVSTTNAVRRRSRASGRGRKIRWASARVRAGRTGLLMMAKTTARAIVVVCLGLFATYTPSAQPRRLGTIEFQSSGAPAARRAFEEGVALLHSFVYEDAAARFRTAEQIDPSFALAYWFDALTYSHALWGDEDVVGAHAALGRLGPDAGARLAKAPDVRERAWGDAVEALFGDGDLRARSIAFAAGMKRVRAAADDDEAMAFTSLAIMGAARFLPPDQQESAYDEAESLARRVFSHQLNHPGAAHYIIHADDAPGRAVRALAAARTYAA